MLGGRRGSPRSTCTRCLPLLLRWQLLLLFRRRRRRPVGGSRRRRVRPLDLRRGGRRRGRGAQRLQRRPQVAEILVLWKHRIPAGRGDRHTSRKDKHVQKWTGMPQRLNNCCSGNAPPGTEQHSLQQEQASAATGEDRLAANACCCNTELEVCTPLCRRRRAGSRRPAGTRCRPTH